MNDVSLANLQARVKDKDRSDFVTLGDYFSLCYSFLVFRENTTPTRIVSPSHRNYIFYQYDERYANRITRPLNSDLFIESGANFKVAFERFIDYRTFARSGQNGSREVRKRLI